MQNNYLIKRIIDYKISETEQCSYFLQQYI